MNKAIEDNSDNIRQILSLSGGKDSSALAIYMRDRVPNMEYAFCDTGEELPETYDYLEKLEAYLGKPIVRLNPDRQFSHYLDIFNGVLPDARTRWCTRMLKIKPFERFVGNDKAINYVGIRADESHRKGYISSKPNITAKYPFIDDGIIKEDVLDILKDAGIGLPAYYNWRSRSGCYFCFFQQRIEWVGLYNNHPKLFAKALAYEKENPINGNRYTWIERESLKELIKPERVAKIREDFARRSEYQKSHKSNARLTEVFCDDEDDETERACLICSL